MNVQILLFDGYETLDAMGPLEILGHLPAHFTTQCVSLHGGLITSAQNLITQTQIANLSDTGIVLIPGGQGTRQLVNNPLFLEALQQLSHHATWVLSVCTGSALLAKAGILDHKTATSNKKAWDWVIAQSNLVKWQRQARWCVDGQFYTSSGISAGMDMTLGFVADQLGLSIAKQVAQDIEYTWHQNPDIDPFA